MRRGDHITFRVGDIGRKCGHSIENMGSAAAPIDGRKSSGHNAAPSNSNSMEPLMPDAASRFSLKTIVLGQSQPSEIRRIFLGSDIKDLSESGWDPSLHLEVYGVSLEPYVFTIGTVSIDSIVFRFVDGVLCSLTGGCDPQGIDDIREAFTAKFGAECDPDTWKNPTSEALLSSDEELAAFVVSDIELWRRFQERAEPFAEKLESERLRLVRADI